MSDRILIVDDDAEVVEMLTWALASKDWEVHTAFNGFEALGKARTTSPDLIILDLMLPDLDGMEVCKTLRRLTATASIPILILSGRNPDEAKGPALEAGADDYVAK